MCDSRFYMPSLNQNFAGWIFRNEVQVRGEEDKSCMKDVWPSVLFTWKITGTSVVDENSGIMKVFQFTISPSMVLNRFFHYSKTYEDILFHFIGTWSQKKSSCKIQAKYEPLSLRKSSENQNEKRKKLRKFKTFFSLPATTYFLQSWQRIWEKFF